MNSLYFNLDSFGYYHQPFFDFDNHAQKKVTESFQQDCSDTISGEDLEIGFTESEIKDLAEEISDKLIVIVKSQLQK